MAQSFVSFGTLLRLFAYVGLDEMAEEQEEEEEERKKGRKKGKKTFGDYCLPGLHENVCFREETKINEKQSFPVSDETLTCSSFVFLLFLLSFSFSEESFD